MAKTDSFGRPYYETAEEYNQAHRRAKASGAYGQIQQEKKAYNHTVGHGTKKQYGQRTEGKVVAAMGLGVGIIIMAIVTIYTMNMVDSGATPEQNWYEEELVIETEVMLQDDNYEKIGVDDVPLVEGFNVVSYKGVDYTIPMTYAEFCLLDVPLKMYPPGGEELYAGYSETLDLVDEDGNIIGFISIENETDEDIPRGECSIKQILFSSDAAYDGDMSKVPDVTFANGLDMTCTYADLEANMGIPTYKYVDEEDEGNIYEAYHWEYYGENHSEYFYANFWNGVMTDFGVVVDTY